MSGADEPPERTGAGPAPPSARTRLEQLLEDAPAPLKLVVAPARPVYRLLAAAAWSTGRLRRGRLLAAALFVGLPALVVLGQLQTLLGAMHLPGENAYILRDLADPSRAEVVVRTWLAHARETTDRFAGPVSVVWIFAAVDTLLFVPAYGLVLGIFSAVAHGRLRGLPETDAKFRQHRVLTAAAFLAVPVLMLVDVLENIDTAIVVKVCDDGCPVVLSGGLAALWWAKWLLAGAILVPLLIAGVAILRASHADRADFLWTAVVLRVQIGIGVVFAFFLMAPVASHQMDDVLRRWLGDWTEPLAAALLAFVLSFVTLAVSWRLLDRDREAAEQQGEPRQPTGDPRPLVLLVAAAAGLAVLGTVLQLTIEGGRGLWALAGIVAAVAVLSLPIMRVPIAAPHRAGYGSATLPALLAALPPVVLGLAAVRAAIFELVYASQWRYLWLVAIGIALQAAGWVIYVRTRERPRAGTRMGRSLSPEQQPGPRVPDTLWLAFVLVVVATIWIWWKPWAAGGAVGTIGVLTTFLVGLSLLGYVALRFENATVPLPFFRILGLRRTPVFLLLLLWGVTAALLDPGGYHDIRVIDRTAGAPTTLEEAWEGWLARQPQGRDAVPLVLVAAEGGGIRAAYWTARALDCALDVDESSCRYVPEGEGGDPLEPGYPGAIFAVSGISGGSLGLVTYFAAGAAREDEDWVDKRLGKDFLAAAGARLLFADLPNGFLKLDLGEDRAAVLEQDWERAWPEDEPPLADGLFATWATGEMPILLLNGTSVNDGCRVNTSVLDEDVEEPVSTQSLRARDCLSMAAFASDSEASPGTESLAATHDLVDVLCEEQDIPLSTAALLSARFPWVSPSGRLTRSDRVTPGCEKDFPTYVVDGGYFDTSAASPVQELWARLEPLVAAHNAPPGDAERSGPCVVPVLLQLDNHYKEPGGPGSRGRPWEALVPIQAVRAARDARENDARQAVALLFSTDEVAGTSPQVGDGAGPFHRYAHLFPRAHPGNAAPLGWALSDVSMDDLTNQLGEDDNRVAVGAINRWFSDDLVCA